MTATGQVLGTRLANPEEIHDMLVERIDKQHRSDAMVVGVITKKAREIISYGHFDSGDPRVPDTVLLWGTILGLRQRFDQFVNVRPAGPLPGVPGHLSAGVLDVVVIRENTEGEYSGAGGRVHRGRDSEVAVETSIFTRQIKCSTASPPAKYTSWCNRIHRL